jgi:hypothetical protein
VSVRSCVTVAFATFSLAPTFAGAQDQPATTVTAAATGIAQFDAHLTTGTVSWNGATVSADLDHRFSSAFAATLGARFEYQDWRFSEPNTFGVAAPWSAVQFPQVSATVTYTPKPYLRFSLAPTVQWDFERGASTADALDYGVIATAGMAFSRTFFIGIGAGVFHQIYETHTYPFPLIYWKISDRWKVTNAFAAGPAGGAGVEVRYAITSAWETAAGGSYRTYYWRLAPDAPESGGIGQNRFIPLFVRLGHTLGTDGRLDLYAAALADGELTVRDASGAPQTRASYGTAPAIGLSARFVF